MKILIITSSFPFYPGEQFLETEILYWAKTKFKEIILLPTNISDQQRLIPDGVKINKCLTIDKKKYIYVFLSIFSPILYRELVYLGRNSKITVKNLNQALKSTAHFIKARVNLIDFINSNGSVDCIYTYWNNNYAYAASSLKKKGIVKNVISRTHGFDLYEERWDNNYMPLKRQFANSFDMLFVLSEQAKSYSKRVYNFKESIIHISPLGVDVPYNIANCSKNETFNILSVSYCVPIKRIDKIIKGIKDFAITNPSLQIQWNHIGDGPLKDDLILTAKEQFSTVSNVKWRFLGDLQNKEVLNFYSSNKIDCFLNTSESEGAPVSIIEAMAFGVPAIAPDVGGISEIISNDCGILLRSEAETEEIVESMQKIYEHSNIEELKMKAKRKILVKFNAEINYPSFIRMLEKTSFNKTAIRG